MVTQIIAQPIAGSPTARSLYIEKMWHRSPRLAPRPQRRFPYTHRFSEVDFLPQQQYVTPLPFAYDKFRCDIFDAPNTRSAVDCQLRRDGAIATNRALSSFNDKLGKSAQLGADIAEGRSSLSMIASRAGQLSSAARSLRKGNLSGFYDSLNINPARRKPASSFRHKSGDVGGVWLEYWFGWAPLISDLYTAAEVLVQARPATRIRARGSVSGHFSNYTSGVELGRYDNQWQEDYSWTTRAQVIADVMVGDPNLVLQTKLGLSNPASIAWELVPWSWLVDWFLPIGEAVDSFSWFRGYKLSNPVYTVFSSAKGGIVDRYNPTGPYRSEVKYGFTDGLTIRRSLQFPSYTFNLRSRFTQLSVTRAATAVSLLVQQLAGMTPRH